MQFMKAGAILLAIISTGAVIGCGSSEQKVEQATDTEVSQMKALRAIFDSVKGDSSQLTPDQKQKFLDYAKGNQAQADQIWSFMKNPRGKESDAQRPFSVGPGGQIMPPGGAPAGGPGANR